MTQNTDNESFSDEQLAIILQKEETQETELPVNIIHPNL